MKLHKAIVRLLMQVGRPMTTTEISSELNKNLWYQKKDGSVIDPYQIRGRTKNHPALFKRNGTTVSLNSQQNTQVKASKGTIVNVYPKKLTEIPFNISLIEKVLMNEKNFKTASSIDNLVPKSPGLYCIRICDIEKLPEPFNTHLTNRRHNIVYIGIASQSLQLRFLNQELRARGHGTFFRSIGAVLGYRPAKGSLKAKANKKNYKFSKDDEMKIIDWINKNLIVNWVTFEGNFGSLETEIIQSHVPLMNLSKNPLALDELRVLREECVRIANN